MTTKFKRIAEGHYDITVDGKRIGSIEKNPNYKQCPWEVRIDNFGKVVYQGYDCFSFYYAKEACINHLNNRSTN